MAEITMLDNSIDPLETTPQAVTDWFANVSIPRQSRRSQCWRS
jgi:hypothetical protein